MHLSFVCTAHPSNPGDFPFWRSEKHWNVTDPGTNFSPKFTDPRTNFGWNFPYRWDKTLNLITILVL